MDLKLSDRLAFFLQSLHLLTQYSVLLIQWSKQSFINIVEFFCENNDAALINLDTKFSLKWKKRMF